jgi:hypothetical protein
MMPIQSQGIAIRSKGEFPIMQAIATGHQARQ